MSSTPKARIDVTCPCGASLTVEASAELCVERCNEFTKAHRGHVAPVVYRDRWYPAIHPTPYYSPTWTNGTFTLNTDGSYRNAHGGMVTAGPIQNTN